MKLNESEVKFYENYETLNQTYNHVYVLHGKFLSGITQLIKQQLFPDKYSDVPEDVLQKAAERGTNIHRLCESADAGFASPMAEVQDYMRMNAEYGKAVECSEYVVSDMQHWASAIDKVYRISDNEFVLADIKTTYTLDIEYVRWQLSIYAYLFELQNPKAKVAGLKCIYLREGKSKMVDCQRIPVDEVKKLLDCGVEGTQYMNPYTIPAEVAQAELQIANLIQQKKEIDEALEGFKARLLELMDESGVKSWECERLKITRKADTIRNTFDTTRFKKDHPDMVDAYMKQSTTKGGILITLKQ